MNNDASQPSRRNDTVLYRCSCGAEVSVDPNAGGKCAMCQREISPKVLQHELALTITIRGKPDHIVPSPSEPSNFDANELVGRNFGHFEIIRPLGRGGMGQVYQALDTSLQRYVAVKILQSGSSGSSSAACGARHVDLLLQEAVAQARVEHPNIVTIYYVGKQDDEPFFAMELVNGVSVAHRIAQGDLSFGEIAMIAIQITRRFSFRTGWMLFMVTSSRQISCSSPMGTPSFRISGWHGERRITRMKNLEVRLIIWPRNCWTKANHPFNRTCMHWALRCTR